MVLGVALDSKLSIENHLRLMSASASSKLGMMKKALYLFGDAVLVLRCFLEFTEQS